MICSGIFSLQSLENTAFQRYVSCKVLDYYFILIVILFGLAFSLQGKRDIFLDQNFFMTTFLDQNSHRKSRYTRIFSRVPTNLCPFYLFAPSAAPYPPHTGIFFCNQRKPCLHTFMDSEPVLQGHRTIWNIQSLFYKYIYLLMFCP